MIINKKEKKCFIHLHKCCGKTISNILINQFNYKEERSQLFQAHDGVNEAIYIKNYYNFISIRDPLEVVCSKISMKIKNNKEFKESDFIVYLDEILNININSISSSKENLEIKNLRNSLYKKFPTGLLTHQLLFQTCDVRNIGKYTKMEDFFINENIIDYIIRKESLRDNLNLLLPKDVVMVHKNSSNLTERFLCLLTPAQIEKLVSREKLFYNLYKGELNDYIRRHR